MVIFDSIKNEETEFPVKDIEAQDIFKGGPLLEVVVWVAPLKGKGIGAETVVAYY